MKRIALVTGGNRGIGLSIVKQLAAKDIRVIIGARNAAHGATIAQQLMNDGFDAGSIQLDVSIEDNRALAVQTVLEREGRIDILVNNAGVALDKWVKIEQLEIDVLRETLEINLYGALHLCQLLLPAMKAQGHGRIVNLSSELGSLGQSTMGGSAAYRISKTALNMLTKLLALELKDHPDILVNAAAPGWVKTELGGNDAPRSPDEGARTPVWLATLPAGGPTGGFFRDEQPYPW